MNINLCSAPAPWEPAEEPDGFVACCMGSAAAGPQHCTCWEAVYDQHQAEPNVFDEPEPREKMCEDCAYRPGSPERSDENEEVRLFLLPDRGATFSCHQGMRRVLEYRHPDGRTVPADPADYQPLTIDGRLYKANGMCADICAGWWALAQKTEML